ncbi:MAG: Rrf2 family transcriptional regulator [Planctomycetaceae bacterium]|nr:HTH-type transcriptional regulator IscR [Planctomycetota bacterium]MCQ3948823.1 transcriptional regulator [Planctomycetota bacterium]NUO16621.1 Rrf2 family transcriptional regulator [Planctomycetaceae bacterium]GIK51542.1 MAG: Rrf2 family transcriptional regulator [Planctomycetota bacterium]
MTGPSLPDGPDPRGDVIFSRKSDYGLRALIFLSERRASGPVTLTEIAERLMIPKAFLSKILQQLAKKGIVRSLKGPSGGFVLASDPKKLTMRDIIVEIDGPMRVFECFANESECALLDDCLMLGVFNKVEEEIGRVLGSYTLADFHFPPGTSSAIAPKPAGAQS